MPKYPQLDDTIVAVSTPMGHGGIGIVRLSGRDALAIADSMFAAKDGGRPSAFDGYTVHYGDVVSADGAVVDEALLTVMRAPKSYTREDVVEFSCHGGHASLRAAVLRACDLGARPAEPGEFTKRAYLNGRIDLAQAEAVIDVINAKTETFLRVSTHQLKGELSTELESIRAVLTDIYVAIEAAVNFPDDDTGAAALDEHGLKGARARIDKLLATADHGRLLKEGIRICICGKANVGKSSLLNVLLKAPRAIVSDIAGTTRDTIEEDAQIKGIPFTLIDTAGILEPRDLIEEEAVRRSHQHIAGADLVLFVLDGAAALSGDDERIMRAVDGLNVLAMVNKSDLPQKIDAGALKKRYGPKRVLKISALTHLGIDKLEEVILENVWHEKRIDTHGILVSNLRHVNALKKAQAALLRAQAVVDDKLPPEFLSEEIKWAVNALDTITGRDVDVDLLETIFTQFCVGK